MRQWAHAGSVFPLVEFGGHEEVGVKPSIDGVEDDIVDDFLIQKVFFCSWGKSLKDC